MGSADMLEEDPPPPDSPIQKARSFFSAAAAMHHYVEKESSHQLQYSPSLEKAGSYLFVQQMCVNITLNHFKQEVLNTDIVLVLRKFQWKLKKIL